MSRTSEIRLSWVHIYVDVELHRKQVASYTRKFNTKTGTKHTNLMLSNAVYRSSEGCKKICTLCIQFSLLQLSLKKDTLFTNDELITMMHRWLA